MGVCRLGRETEQTSALYDSWHTTEKQLLKAAHSFLPANGEAEVLFWTSCSVSFSPPSIMHPRYLGAFVFRGLPNCGTEQGLYSFMGREEGVTGSFVCVEEIVHTECKHTVSLWF